jgi:uncharacterized protein (DUF362 family)
MEMAKVSIVKSNGEVSTLGEIREMVKKSIDLLGGIGQFIKPGERVFIKPNILLPKSPEFAVTTEPKVVQSVVHIVLNEGKARKVIVGDIPRLKLWSREVMKETGIEAAAVEAGAEVRYIDEEPQREVEIPGGVVMSKTLLPETVLSVDKIIYLPKLKTHYITKMTGAVKSAHGLQVDQEREKFHREDLHHKLVDLLRAIRPHLCIVDAITVMEGQGPAFGNPVRFDTIVSGPDPVAVDSVCASMIGFDPFEIPTIRIAHYDGLGQGDLKKIDIVGNSLEEVRKPVKRADVNIEGVHPKIETFVGGTCVGCLTSSRGFIDSIIARGLIEKLEKVSVVTGLDIHFGHEPKGEMVFVLGDCAEKYRNKGIFIPGCIPFDSWTEAIKRVEEYVNQKGHRRG